VAGLDECEVRNDMLHGRMLQEHGWMLCGCECQVCGLEGILPLE